MISLRFYSDETVSKYPVQKHSDEMTYVKVKRTTVVLEETDNGGNTIEAASASVVCHPKERNIPVVGQKYAMAALTRQIKDRTTRAMLWNEFAKKSKAASRVMGKA